MRKLFYLIACHCSRGCNPNFVTTVRRFSIPLAITVFSFISFASDLRLGNASGVAGSTLPVSLEFTNNEAVVGLRFDMSFDPSALQPVAAVPDRDLQGHRVVAAVLSPGLYRVIVNPTRTPLGLVPSGQIVQVHFKILEGTSPGVIGLDLATVQFADIDAREGLLGNLASGSVTVRVENAAPLAGNTSLSLVEDTVASGQFQALDADSDPLTFQIAQQGQLGTLHLTNPGSGAFTYVPLPNAEGMDQVTFTVQDPAGASASAWVQVQIQPVNDAPTATSFSLQTQEDEAVTATPVVADVDLNESFSFTILSPPTQGELSLDSGLFTYSPTADYHGTDSFIYRAVDRGGQSVDGVAQISVASVNDAPTAVALSFDLMEDAQQMMVPVVTDIDDHSHRFLIVMPPQHGTASVQGDRIFYVPDANFNGQDQFMIRAIDSGSLQIEGPATVTVRPVNDSPSSASAMLWACLDLDSPLADAVVTDVDLQFEGDSFTFTVLTQPDHGTAMVTDNQLGYTPNPAFTGSDSFLFQATDSAGASVQGEATVSVVPFEGLIVLGGRARGLNPLVFDATTDCGMDPFLYEWQELGAGQVQSAGSSFSPDPPPGVTTDYEVIATHPVNGQEQRHTFRALVHPVGLDLNQDGLNDLQDLYLVLPFWLQSATPYEADGDGALTILDLLYINLDDATPTP